MGYLIPQNMDEAFAGLEAGAQIIAGGTDWFPANGEQIKDGALLDITQLPGLCEVTRKDGAWRIGAGVTWSDLAGAKLPPAFDGLKAAAREVGSVQIQNVATLAGNICNASPAADGVPPLLVLNALVEIASRRGNRVLPLSEFILGPRKTALQPGEMVAAIIVPDVPEHAVSSFVKLGARKYLVISIAMVAVQMTNKSGRMEGVRLAVGSCGPVARRLHGLEARLNGCCEVPDISVDDLSELAPMDDLRGSAEYRLDVVAESIQRGLRMLLNG